MPEFVKTVLLIVGALFPIVNPLGNVPIFLTLTDGFTVRELALPVAVLALSSTGYIARMTTAGVLTEFTVPTINASPYGITTGLDGNLWFTELQ